MSLQLILYPQNYNGQYSVTSTPNYTEYVGNYSFYNSGITTYSVGGSQPWNTFQAAQTPSSAWQGWHDDGSVYNDAPAPTLTSGRLRLPTAAGGSWSGARQKITGLTGGAQYDITFETNAANTGTIYFGDGVSTYTDSFGTTFNCLVTLQTFANLAAGVHTFTVTAPSSTATLDINFYGTGSTFVDFNYISIKENISSVPTTDIYFDGQVICDLYNDESIPLKLSIDEFKNVAEKAQSFSNPFNLPSTKRNNKIFSHLFDTQISVNEDAYAFNPYKKTKAVLKEDGHTLFDGFLTLIDINNKDGEISYNVNLYSNTITLKDTLKDKKLSDFNSGFSELTHAYNYTNIDLSQDGTGVVYTASSTSGFRSADTIKYPLCNWNGEITLNASDQPKINKLENGYRPWLKMKYLVDRIFDEAGFTYTSTFLSSTAFTKLYMDFSGENDAEVKTAYANRGCDPSGAVSDTVSGTSTTTSFANLQFDSSNINSEFAAMGYDQANHRFEAQQDNTQLTIDYYSKIRHSGSLGTGAYQQRWKKTEAATGNITFYDEGSFTGYGSNVVIQYSGVLYISCNDGDYLEYQHRQISGSGNFAQTDHAAELINLHMNATTGDTVITSNSYFQSERGKLKQWNLIEGIINMFNLVLLKDKDNPTNFIIEPYKDIFVDNSDIVTHDWTSKVDISDIKLKPVELKKIITFKYDEDKDDYAKGIYKSATGVGYGNTEIDADSFTLLVGETKVVATPFAATYIKPLFDITPEIICPAIFKMKDDGSTEGYKNKPRICYDNGEITISDIIKIPAQNDVAAQDATKYLQFSHLSTIPSVSATTQDYNFGASQLINIIGDTPIDNLFNVYWAPYYDELYNADTKEMSINVYLTPSEIANFNFFDKVQIKNRTFRVNKIEYKAGELSKVEFILIG